MKQQELQAEITSMENIVDRHRTFSIVTIGIGSLLAGLAVRAGLDGETTLCAIYAGVASMGFGAAAIGSNIISGRSRKVETYRAELLRQQSANPDAL